MEAAAGIRRPTVPRAAAAPGRVPPVVPPRVETPRLAGNGAMDGMAREGVPAARNHRCTGDGDMHSIAILRASARTFLTHLFGHGLKDDRYRVQRFQSLTPSLFKEECVPQPGQTGRLKLSGT